MIHWNKVNIIKFKSRIKCFTEENSAGCMQDPWVKFAKHSSIMFVKAIMALVSYFIVFGYLLHLPQCSAWKRGQNNLSFNGALFCRQNFALKTDILRKVKTFGEIQCAFVCLSENDCVAQTYCDDSPRRKNPKGTCYLHKNGVKNEENSARLVKSKRCTFQQYMDLDVSQQIFSFLLTKI